MNITQRDNLINRVQGSFNDEAINGIIKRFNDQKLTATSKYSLEEFISLLKRMCTQLENELKTDNWKFLPIGYNEPHEYGNVNIEQNFNQFISFLRDPFNNLANIDTYLNTLIYYQVLNNFWDKSSIKYHTKEGLNIADLNNKSKVLYEQLKDALEKITTAQNQVEELREKINTYSKSFNDKNITAAEMMQEIDSKSKKIADLLAEASNTENKIAELGKTQEEKLKEINTNISDYKKEFELFLSMKNLLQKETTEKLEETKSKLESATQGIQFVDSKKSDIIKFTGLAADGMLGTKFDQRQSKLEGGIKFWRNAIPWMTGLSITWVIVVFYCFNKDTNPFWIGLVINILKTAPAFILLGFVFKQYSKERNLEEEYAFKATVAMTLTAYSDMLKEADAENNKSRQDMLLKSIQQVYTQPKIHSEKSPTIFGFRTKELNETIKNLSESVKNIKPV